MKEASKHQTILRSLIYKWHKRFSDEVRKCEFGILLCLNQGLRRYRNVALNEHQTGSYGQYRQLIYNDNSDVRICIALIFKHIHYYIIQLRYTIERVSKIPVFRDQVYFLRRNRGK